MVQKMLGQPVDAFSNRCIGDDQGENEGANSCKRSLRILASVVRRMHGRVSEKGARR
jgi:hypothetical protein